MFPHNPVLKKYPNSSTLIIFIKQKTVLSNNTLSLIIRYLYYPNAIRQDYKTNTLFLYANAKR